MLYRLRFSDFNKLKKEHIQGDTFVLKAEKTNELVYLPIHRELLAIMQANEVKAGNPFPRSISNQKLNQFLKEIAKLAGWDAPVVFTSTVAGKRVEVSKLKYECITTHTARRSFATNLYLKTGDIYFVMQFTGHKTEKAFRAYIRVTPTQQMNRIREIWKMEKVA